MHLPVNALKVQIKSSLFMVKVFDLFCASETYAKLNNSVGRWFLAAAR